MSVFVPTAWMQARLSASVPFNYAPALLQPAVYLILTSSAFHDWSLPARVQLFVGVLLLGIWGSVVWTAGMMLRWDAMTGTLELYMTSPVSMLRVIVGRSVGSSMFAIIGVLFSSSVCLVFLHGQLISRASLVAIIVSTLLALVAASGAGCLISALLLPSRRAARVIELLVFPVVILSGLVVPLSYLPAVVRPMSWASAFYWIDKMSLEIMQGRYISAALIGALALLIGLAYLSIGMILVGVTTSRLRRTGNVERA